MQKNSYTSNDDIFAQAPTEHILPQSIFPREEQSYRAVYQAVRDELLLDGNSRQNLATFCQTWVEPEVHQLMNDCIDKNMIDKDEYPQTAAIEMRCVRMLADLWHAPSPITTLGCSTIGSSEAAMLGGMAMKWRWRAKREAEGKSTAKPNLVTGPVQVCWHKFARYWDVELREIPMEAHRLCMTPEEVLKYVDENTIGVVPTLGLTFTGVYEPVKAISDALDLLQEQSGLDIPIHVDAASGGFLAPFMEPELIWDFRLPRVKSINASGHKFGLAPLGVGWVVWREKTDLPEELIFWVNYLGDTIPTFAINFSRPGGQIIAQYYIMLRLGREGYSKVHQACYDTVQYLASELEKLAIFQFLHVGKNGIPALTWSCKKEVNLPFTLYDLSERLRMRGWQVPAYSMPQNCTDLVVMRALIRHGFSRDMANLFLHDMRQAVAFLSNQEPQKPLEKLARGYSHAGR